MIKTMFWNVRGIGNAPTLSRLKKLCKLHSLSLLALCECMIDRSRLDDIRQKLKFQHAVANVYRCIWVFHSLILLLN